MPNYSNFSMPISIFKQGILELQNTFKWNYIKTLTNHNEVFGQNIMRWPSLPDTAEAAVDDGFKHVLTLEPASGSRKLQWYWKFYASLSKETVWEFASSFAPKTIYSKFPLFTRLHILFIDAKLYTTFFFSIQPENISKRLKQHT